MLSSYRTPLGKQSLKRGEITMTETSNVSSGLSLSGTQRAFTRCLNLLQTKILADGLEYTLGEGKRTREQAAINSLTLFDRAKVGALLETKYPVLAEAVRISSSRGIKNSVHILGLAQDLNIFRGDEFL